MSNGSPVKHQVDWARGIPNRSEGDLKMTTVWSELGFVYNQGTATEPNFLEQERNFDDTISDQWAGPVPKQTKKTKK